MNDDLMFDYLLQMGAMRPEQDELKRKQAMVDALRNSAMKPAEGQMIGKHYVGPGLAGAIGQLGTAYFASQGQRGVNEGLSAYNAKQGQMLEELRKRRKQPAAVMQVPTEADVLDPYGQFSYGNRT